MRSFLLLGFLILNVATFVASQTDREESFEVYAASDRLRRIHVRKLFDEQVEVTNKLLEEAAETDRTYFAVSPFIITLGLSMLSIAARSHTDAAFREVFKFERSHIPRKVASSTVLGNLDRFVGLQLATGLFVPLDIRVDPDFSETVGISYDATVKKMDFDKSDEASRSINKWCEEKTKGHIKEVTTAADINQRTSLLLVNCLHFTGTWMRNFDAGKTRERTFYLDDGTEKQVLSMVGQQNVLYGELPEVDAKFIELSILDQNEIHVMNMIVVLPEEKDGLPYLEDNFHKIDFTDLLDRRVRTEMMVRLPKFEINGHLSVKNLVAQMGLDKIFDPSADFSGVTDSQHPYLDDTLLHSTNPYLDDTLFGRSRSFSGTRKPFISNIIQKFSIEINERPDEIATGNTAWNLQTSRAMNPVTDFIVDHPFYAIFVTTHEKPMILATVRFTGA